MSGGFEDDPDFDALLDYIHRNQGFDLTAYKRASLGRRIRSRIQGIGYSSVGDYFDHLQAHPDEFTELFNTILINVTSFFRDPKSWEYLRENVLPRICESKAPGEQLRVWSAGCASGEEAFTLAMLLSEALGEQPFVNSVKIYATDADESALQDARHAAFTRESLDAVPEALRQKYFEPEGPRFVFRPDLRRAVIFGRHDLNRDAPISRLDLLVCRNTLMYFNAEAQKRILPRFHFAVGDDGFLFLGRAEMLLTHGNIFRAVDLRHRIFQRVAEPAIPMEPEPRNATGDRHEPELERELELQRLAFNAGADAQFVVDLDGTLVAANDSARRSFGIRDGDIRRPIQDVEVSYRPVELRSLIEECLRGERAIQRASVERVLDGGEIRYFDVEVMPLRSRGRKPRGVVVRFEDVTSAHELRAELQHAKEELETTNEELQSTNEELETTNEELQSTNEELETTNEELQSTNEELETMNEELQSTNAELQSLNTELHEASQETAGLNRFLNSVVSSLHSGVVVVDEDLKIRTWNERAMDLWGLREEEVIDRSLADLDIGLPIDELQTIVQRTLDSPPGLEEVSLDAVNRRGKSIRCRITCTIRLGQSMEKRGVVLVMEDSA